MDRREQTRLGTLPLKEASPLPYADPGPERVTTRGTEVDLTIVIPTHNRAGLLRRCLAAIAPCRGEGVELVVVDDGSTDETPTVLEEAYAQGLVDQVLRNPVARGPATARNRGWRAGRGKIIAFTDDDCETGSGWARVLLEALRGADAQIAGVGGVVRPARTGLISDYMTLHRILEPPRSLSYLVTANSAFRRSALEQIGGFDEAVSTPGGEDPGLCMALRRLGYRFRFVPEAVVTHHYRESPWDFLKTFYRYGKGCRIVMDR